MENLLIQVNQLLLQHSQSEEASPTQGLPADLQPLLQELRTSASPMAIFGFLAPLLLQSNETSDAQDPSKILSNANAARLTGLLLHLDPATYLSPAARAIRQHAEALDASGTKHVVSAELQQALLQQVAGAATVQVSTDATATLVVLARQQGPEWTQSILQSILQQWQSLKDRTLGVRCATALMHLARLGSEYWLALEAIQADQWFLQELQIQNDPLYQMSLLDLLAEDLLSASNVDAVVNNMALPEACIAWLSTNETLWKTLFPWMDPLQPDSILGGPALRVATHIAALGQLTPARKQQVWQILHNYPQSGELDRLAWIDAVSSLAMADLGGVLNDNVLLQQWLSVPSSQPKWRAILWQSVARVVRHPHSADAEVVVLYQILGRINHESDATRWLLQSQVQNCPWPEVRVAVFELWRAMCRKTTFVVPDFWLDYLLTRQPDQSSDERVAQYHLLQAMMEYQTPRISDKQVQALQDYLRQGPHFKPVQRYDVITEQ